MHCFKCIVILWPCFLVLRVVCQKDKNFFRSDYTFLEERGSFYKYHTILRPWEEAKKTCELESASLFYPEDVYEAEAIIAFWNKTQTSQYIYIGISDSIAKEVFTTVNGIPLRDVYNKWAPGEPNKNDDTETCLVMKRDGTLYDDPCHKKYGFICSKSKSSLKWNNICNSPDLEYKYYLETERCYKFHTTPATWSEAARVCTVEQSDLAIINSETEAKYLTNISKNAIITNDISPNIKLVALGFKNRRNEGWKTIKGEKLQRSGYNMWAENQPNEKENEKCGSMDINGLLNQISCDSKNYFICERENPHLSVLQEKFGKQSNT